MSRRAAYAILLSLVAGYLPSRSPPSSSSSSYRLQLLKSDMENAPRGVTFLQALSTAININPNPADDDKSQTPFDMDFAEAMSKPLPEWYESQKVEREKLLKELEENRERIVREFRAKYEVSEEVKQEERTARWNFLDLRERQRDAKKKAAPLSTSTTDVGGETADKVAATSAAAEKTTKEKWQKFWEEEEKATGFYLPGFFEVFPEFKWPTWAKKRGGGAIECETDADCQFPQACCPHPIIPWEKFCCTGWTQRILVPAYAKQTAATDRRTRDEADSDTRDEEKREREAKKPWETTD